MAWPLSTFLYQLLHWAILVLKAAAVCPLSSSLPLLLIWVIGASLNAEVWKQFILKVKFLNSVMIQVQIYQLRVLSKSHQNTFRIIKMLSEKIINISMPGILMNQATMINQLLNAQLLPSLTKQES